MPRPADTPLPVDPPPGVPLDQTKAEIYYGGSGAGIGIVWLWRKIRSRFAARRSSGSS